MYQPCHLFSPATVPCSLSTAPALRRSAASSVAHGRGAAPNSVPRCQRSRRAWISCLPTMNACDAQAKPPPAPTPTLRRLRLFVQHNNHGLDAHLATRRSGDQCTRGPLQTPSDGATPRRTRTQSVLGEGFLSRSRSPSHRPKSFEIAAHCGGCMRRSGASDSGTKGALASLRKRPSARSMSLIRSCRLFFV